MSDPGGESTPDRIHLSVPHLSGDELDLVHEAFASNWIAPLGPQVDAFEAEFAAEVGVGHAAATASGTAALHLALLLAGVGPGDEVLVSSLTFAASVFPIRYLHASPVFIDSERVSWNLDPALVAEAVEARVRAGRPPRALIVVHLLGQCAEMRPLQDICRMHGIALIEDAAEALGSSYEGRPPGGFGMAGIFSFNGNKIITTSGGGMLVSDNEALVAKARKLASQARDEALHYEHSEIGYNYRMSNVLAALGRGQLRHLEERVLARRARCETYRTHLGEVPGVSIQPEAPWGRHTRWLTCVTVDPVEFGVDARTITEALRSDGIDARPLWKPMHRQPVFEGAEVVGGVVSEELFERGICLPSSSSLTESDQDRVCATFLRAGGALR